MMGSKGRGIRRGEDGGEAYTVSKSTPELLSRSMGRSPASYSVISPSIPALLVDI